MTSNAYRCSLAILALWITLSTGQRAQAQCGWVYQFNSGSGHLSIQSLQTPLSVGGLSGQFTSRAWTNNLGYQPAQAANFMDCYLQSGLPLAVQVAPGSLSGSTLAPSAQPQMILAWTDGANQVPVSYRVYFGQDSTQLVLVATTTTRTWQAQNLVYASPYYWRVDTFDPFGRHTLSVQTFQFSLAPVPIASLYCAPNPFRAGRQPTTFIFTIAGAGRAELRIYVLPHGDEVFSTTLSGLKDGANLWAYDGRDNQGQILFNGVYLAVLETHGAFANGIQKFKFIVAK